jgi:hypothetical protein
VPRTGHAFVLLRKGKVGMSWESDETEPLDVLTPAGDRDARATDPLDPDELEKKRRMRIWSESREDDVDDFEGFDEEDFDDDFDDDFEEEQDEEYDAENEEYPDTDFGTGADMDDDAEIEIEGDIEGDFDDGEAEGEEEESEGEGEDESEEIPEE